MENNDIITTEAIEEITEAIPTGNSNLKTMVEVGFIGTLGAVAWEFIVKPVCRWGKRKYQEKKALRKAKMLKEAEPDDMKDSVEELEIDE